MLYSNAVSDIKQPSKTKGTPNKSVAVISTDYSVFP